MIQPIKIVQEQYEKMSDDLCFLGQNYVLRFNVSLASKSDDGKRFHFHKEYEYNSEKYTNINYNLMTVRRHFDFYLSIESLKTMDYGKEFIMIRAQDMIYVQNQLRLIYKWFTSKEYENLFAVKGNKLVMLGKVESIFISDLAMDKYLEFVPIVIDYENKSSMGVRMFIASNENYIDMTVDRFAGLLYLILNLNMYESAQLMVNYLQRPEYGTNSYTFQSNNVTQDESEPFIESKTNRKIGGAKQKSFFDKMDDL